MLLMKNILTEVVDANLLEQHKQYTFFVDLDGVLVNFDQGFKDITNMSKETYVHMYGKKELWATINSKGPSWWENLQWMPDGKQLWDVVKNFNVKILSSGTTKNTGDLAKVGKLRWIKNNLGDVESIIVDASHLKQNYADAKETNVLIDDLPSNIIQWNAQGGTGILHKSTESTLNKLKQLQII
jgi:hypothetical protein